MSNADRNALRQKCDERRSKHNSSPAGNAFACAICPASYVCDIPLKKRALLFGGSQPCNKFMT